MSAQSETDVNRNWSIEELRVLIAIYFNSSFSIGDDARDECRAIADCFGRTPSSIDRQWRNVDAIVKGKGSYNVGALLKQVTNDYLSHPSGGKAVAIAVCEQQAWPLETLISEGRQAPLSTKTLSSSDSEIQAAFRKLLDRLEFKLFTSGSQGFYCQGKIVIENSKRYQAQVTAVLIGSRNDLTITLQATKEEVAYALFPILDSLQSKTFKTGRVGYYTNGKATVGMERFQVAIQAVQLGEK